jgi:hypothetical protein
VFRFALFLYVVSAALAFQAAVNPLQTAADLGRVIRESGLDAAECYRVRDLNFIKDDIKLYLNDGYLIFSKPVMGQRLAAVFTADNDGGDGEVIVIPPTRSERQSLAGFTQSPNLDEHFRALLMIATDDSIAALRGSLEREDSPKKAPEMGALLAEQWNPVLTNISGPMQMRLVADLWSGRSIERGLAFFAFSGKALGNFDILSDARANHRMVIRQQTERSGHDSFNVWTNFLPRNISPKVSANGGRTEPVPPTASAPGQAEPEFQLSHYRIDAEIGNDLGVKATTRVTVRNGQYPLRAFPFGIARAMQVTAVSIDGAPAELMRDDSQRGRITGSEDETAFLAVAPAALAPGSQHEFEFEHQGNVIATRGEGVYFVGARGSWYPHVAGQFATYDLTFRYPKRLTLVAAGDSIEDRIEGDLRITHRDIAVAIGAAGFNLGMYEKVTGTAAGVNFEVYGNRNLEASLQPVAMPSFPGLSPDPPGLSRSRFPRTPQSPPPLAVPPDPLARLRAVASDVAASMEFFSGLFGPPVMKTLTVAPIPGTFGQGFPGLLYLSTFAYLDPQSRPSAMRSAREQVFFSDLMVPHEVAHQWWGNMIGSQRIEDEWLLEALANYSSLLWLEKKKGVKEIESVLDSYRAELLSKNTAGVVYESAGPVVWGQRLEGWPSSGAWRVVTYGKGTWILHMLRHRMGDPAFLKLLAELRRRYEFKPVSTAGFQALARELLPKGVNPEVIDTFFDSWVYGTGIPSLRLRYTVKGTAPAVKLSGTLEQSGADDGFSVDTPVEVQFAKGLPQTIWVRTTGDEQNFTATLRQLPARVIIRDDILMKK